MSEQEEGRMNSEVPSSKKFTITSNIINDKPDGSSLSNKKPTIISNSNRQTQNLYNSEITQSKCHGWMPQGHNIINQVYSPIQESEDSDKFMDFEELGSNNMEEQYNQIVDEMALFRDTMNRKIGIFQKQKHTLIKEVQILKEKKKEIMAYVTEYEFREKNLKNDTIDLQVKIDEFQKEKQKFESEKQIFDSEKDAWDTEKKRIVQIQPLSEIVELNVSGKKEFDIRKSTLCQIQGSALEAMFSGRHKVQEKDGKFFLDRNPKSFAMMIDFIRNSGVLYEEQKNNWQMLQVELQYWGINENHFKQKDEIKLIQEILDRPIGEIFDKKEERQFLYDQLNKRAKFDVKQLLNESKLKFNENFRIKRVEEIATIEYGENFSQRCIIGKGYQARPNGLFEGELIPLMTGTHELDGFGRFISNRRFEEGEFRVNRLHGTAVRILSNGQVEEGQFQNDVLVE